MTPERGIALSFLLVCTCPAKRVIVRAILRPYCEAAEFFLWAVIFQYSPRNPNNSPLSQLCCAITDH